MTTQNSAPLQANPHTIEPLQIQFPLMDETDRRIPVPRVPFMFPDPHTGSSASYAVMFRVCQTPRCACASVRVEGATLTSDGAPVTESQRGFWIDVQERSLVTAPELEADPQALQLANFLLPRFDDAAWQQLHDWFFRAKIEAIETSDLADVDITDLPEASDGLMVPFVEVFPLGLSLYFEFENALWGGDESYCVQHNCRCTQLVLSFLQFKDANGKVAASLRTEPALRYDYRSHATELLDPGPAGTPPARELLAALKQAHPSLDLRLELHHQMVKFLYSRRRLASEMLVNERLKASIAAGPQKIGRNDLCPCGSGKKFKKCCGG